MRAIKKKIQKKNSEKNQSVFVIYLYTTVLVPGLVVYILAYELLITSIGF